MGTEKEVLISVRTEISRSDGGKIILNVVVVVNLKWLTTWSVEEMWIEMKLK